LILLTTNFVSDSGFGLLLILTHAIGKKFAEAISGSRPAQSGSIAYAKAAYAVAQDT
jgi:hypothetical protein